MRTDYASRSKHTARVRTRGKPAARPTRAARNPASSAAPGFSAPSFSAGVLFGGALVVLAAYAPAVFEETRSTVRGEQKPTQPEIVFDFPEVLQESEVVTDPDAYPAETAPSTAAPPNATRSQAATAGRATPVDQEYLLQAASLRGSGDADALRARLRGMGLPASTDRVVLDTGTWYRVTVGPYSSQVEAQRALTKLREQNLSALLIKLG